MISSSRHPGPLRPGATGHARMVTRKEEGIQGHSVLAAGGWRPGTRCQHHSVRVAGAPPPVSTSDSVSPSARSFAHLSEAGVRLRRPLIHGRQRDADTADATPGMEILRGAAPGRRPLAVAWWALLALRGLLPAGFVIAMGSLVGAVQGGRSLTGPLIAVGLLFVAHAGAAAGAPGGRGQPRRPYRGLALRPAHRGLHRAARDGPPRGCRAGPGHDRGPRLRPRHDRARRCRCRSTSSPAAWSA